jgi:tetratricopeptide (TPR) repeat protein
MSANARMRAIVAVVAVAAAGVVAGVVYATRQDPAQPKALCKHGVPVGIYPGVASKNIGAVRKALAEGPKRAARALEALAAEQPKDPVVQFNYATALYCAGFDEEAVQAYRKAKKAGRDTRYEITADNILHPQFFKDGYPPFEYLGHDTLLVQGQIAQRAGHQRTAERLWARAARLNPDDPAAQVAAAVGRFDMDDLSASFSRLGPLVERFPTSQTVRFHLGLLLVWTGQGKQALVELRDAQRLGPKTPIGREAAKLLAGVAKTGTKQSQR